MSKIAKGTRVYRILNWDHEGTVKVVEYTVASWGKKEGTLLTVDGQNAKFQVYPDQEQGQYGRLIVPVADVKDVQAFALEWAVRWQAAERERLESCLGNPHYSQKYIADEIAKLHEPRVIFGTRVDFHAR